MKSICFNVVFVQALLILMFSDTTSAGDTVAGSARPRELGRVRWLRGFDAAVDKARAAKRPILVLFQEVPGCHTCVTYGDKVLSHPLVVEAAEPLFIPVAVYNNIKGDDERTLKSFNEPPWNNPVVRIINPDGKGLADRVAGDYSVAGITNAMVAALEKHGGRVPQYLRLLAEETAARKLGVQRATFVMHCFWEGESALGRLPGVVSTMPGFIGDDEVVELVFDPRRIGFESLITQAEKLDCADRVYTRDNKQQTLASRLIGAAAVRSDAAVHPDKDPKYYMSKTLYRHVPMTALQAARVNAAIHLGEDLREFLSPRQVELYGVIEAHPDAGWPDAIGAADFSDAWRKALQFSGSLRR